jgi:hypothetical protein
LNKLLAGVTIAQGGVLPNIQAVFCPRRPRRPKSFLISKPTVLLRATNNLSKRNLLALVVPT